MGIAFVLQLQPKVWSLITNKGEVTPVWSVRASKRQSWRTRKDKMENLWAGLSTVRELDWRERDSVNDRSVAHWLLHYQWQTAVHMFPWVFKCLTVSSLCRTEPLTLRMARRYLTANSIVGRFSLFVFKWKWAMILIDCTSLHNCKLLTFTLFFF